MNRTGFDSVSSFLGREVEHTPALGMKTLFVVGYQTQDQIDAVLHDPFTGINGEVQHIFFGANDSYHPTDPKDIVAWASVIWTYLNRGYWCSLDIPFQYVADFNEDGLCEHSKFIPIIKVPVPYVRLWNYNTCVKIDDRDFADTNPGVWVHRLHQLMNPDQFTDWGQYQKDQPLTTNK